MDCLNDMYGQNVVIGFVGEFIGVVVGVVGDCQCVVVGVGDEIYCLIGIGQKLVVIQFVFGV